MKQTGDRGEDAAASYLEMQGFAIIERNWRNKYAEIDIIASKKSRVYFVEVKYRKTAEHGDGLEYITPKKLQQMDFAAKMWISNQSALNDYSLSAIAVSGHDFKVDNFIEDIY